MWKMRLASHRDICLKEIFNFISSEVTYTWKELWPDTKTSIVLMKPSPFLLIRANKYNWHEWMRHDTLLNRSIIQSSLSVNESNVTQLYLNLTFYSPNDFRLFSYLSLNQWIVDIDIGINVSCKENVSGWRVQQTHLWNSLVNIRNIFKLLTGFSHTSSLCEFKTRNL